MFAYLENLTTVIDSFRHICTISVELWVTHLVDFFHNFFVGEGIETDNVWNILHELIDGDSAGVVRVRNAELCVKSIDCTFSKFLVADNFRSTRRQFSNLRQM